MTNITSFSQFMETLDHAALKKLVGQYGTVKHAKGIMSWTYLVTMMSCQFPDLNSLRDVSIGLKSASGNLNLLGVF